MVFQKVRCWDQSYLYFI
uniref:Uncharacterized protein n=1 Tax=Anguilla anguilla TaxID=7936 RepID=A0A0E9VB63_ANGAN